MYQSNARSLNVISNWATFVPLSVICFASHIFSQINKLFSGSFDPFPQNSGNLIVGSFPPIVKFFELPPLRGVDT
jgi:hypothetical protein